MGDWRWAEIASLALVVEARAVLRSKGGNMNSRQDELCFNHGTTTGSDERPAQRLAGTLLLFDLTAELAQLQAESTWELGDRNAITLVKEGDLRVTLTAL